MQCLQSVEISEISLPSASLGKPLAYGKRLLARERAATEVIICAIGRADLTVARINLSLFMVLYYYRSFALMSVEVAVVEVWC